LLLLLEKQQENEQIHGRQYPWRLHFWPMLPAGHWLLVVHFMVHRPGEGNMLKW
jgi:hypothetical protein